MNFVMAASENTGSALPPVGALTWAVFLGFVAVVLAFDLLVLNRKHEEPTLRKSALQTGFFVSLAILVMVCLFFFTDLGANGAGQFLAAYVTEWTLSVDNIFVIALIMTFFAVPREYQHKVLFWGIIGALVMRLVFITVGIAVVKSLAIVTAILGLFLIYSAWKIATSDDEDADVSEMRSYKLFTRLVPTTKRFYADKFFTRQEGGKLKATPLFVCVLVVEATDLVFAIDSVPAVLAITSSAFIAFSSNVMAVMGLRSVFFLFSHIQDKVTRLNEGLAIILAGVGVKMIAANEQVMGWVGIHPYHAPTWLSLGFIFTVIIGSVIASLIWPKKTEVNTELVAADPNDVMVEVFIDAGDTMRGEWDSGMIQRYVSEFVQVESASEYDTDGLVPAFAFGDRVEPLGTFPNDEVNLTNRPDLGPGSDLAAVLAHAHETALRTTGKFIFVIVTDGRVNDERAARQAFVSMPSNAFILFVRVSDEPGGAEFLQGLDDYNVGDADRCDTIHATDDFGQPKEQIGEVIGREIDDWVSVTV